MERHQRMALIFLLCLFPLAIDLRADHGNPLESRAHAHVVHHTLRALIEANRARYIGFLHDLKGTAHKNTGVSTLRLRGGVYGDGTEGHGENRLPLDHRQIEWPSSEVRQYRCRVYAREHLLKLTLNFCRSPIIYLGESSFGCPTAISFRSSGILAVSWAKSAMFGVEQGDKA